MIVQGDATGSPPVTDLVASTPPCWRGAIGLSQFSARETGITTPQRRLLVMAKQIRCALPPDPRELTWPGLPLCYALSLLA